MEQGLLMPLDAKDDQCWTREDIQLGSTEIPTPIQLGSAPVSALALGRFRSALFLAGLRHVIADEVLIEHGNSECNVPM